MQRDYIYGKLNSDEIVKEYVGKQTETTNTIVDNKNNIIEVNVKKTPGTLTFTRHGNPIEQYDGSQNKTVEVETNFYDGNDTETADTDIDNMNNIIKVNVKKVPNELIIKENNNELNRFDGSQETILQFKDSTTTNLSFDNGIKVNVSNTPYSLSIQDNSNTELKSFNGSTDTIIKLNDTLTPNVDSEKLVLGVNKTPNDLTVEYTPINTTDPVNSESQYQNSLSTSYTFNGSIGTNIQINLNSVGESIFNLKRDKVNNSQIKNEYDNLETNVYASKYVNDNFAPLSFTNALYLLKYIEANPQPESQEDIDNGNYYEIVEVSTNVFRYTQSTTYDSTKTYYIQNGNNELIIDEDAPIISEDNEINILNSTRNDYSWSSQDNPTTFSNYQLLATRKLEQNITINKSNGFTIELPYTVSTSESINNTDISFGARIKVSTDNGISYNYISSNQSFGTESITLDEDAYNNIQVSGGLTAIFSIKTDLLEGNVSYPIGTLLSVEIFEKHTNQGYDPNDGSTGTNELNYTFYFGVNKDNANKYGLLQFNFANISINTNQIADGSITYNKLSTTLQNSINEINNKQPKVFELQNITFSTWTSTTISDIYNLGYTYESSYTISPFPSYLTSSTPVYVEVNLPTNEIYTGNYCTIATYDTSTQAITIYSKKNTSIIVPSIICTPIM